MSAGARQFPVHKDARGELLVVEGAEVGFAVRRVFTVRGSADRLPRGGHAAQCHELIVLVAGQVDGTVRGAAGELEFVLAAPGQSVHIGPDDFVDYTLDADSVVLVLCDRSFENRPVREGP